MKAVQGGRFHEGWDVGVVHLCTSGTAARAACFGPGVGEDVLIGAAPFSTRLECLLSPPAKQTNKQKTSNYSRIKKEGVG